MELRLLRTFKAVAEGGSFTQAAKRIHVTQAAVSVHIRQLEEEVGAPLFLRVNKKLYLTEAGRALLSHAEKIIRAHDEAKADLAAMGGSSRGRLHIGVASTAITRACEKNSILGSTEAARRLMPSSLIPNLA